MTEKDSLQNLKYDEAIERLESIVEKMENDELDLDSLTSQLKTAQALIKYCKERLTKTDEELKKLLEA